MLCECGKEIYLKGLCRCCYRQLPHIKLKRKEENKRYHSKPDVKERAKQKYMEIKNNPNGPKLNIKLKQEQRNNTRNKTYRNNVLYNLKCKLRTRLRNYLKRKRLYKNDNAITIIGCTPQKLKEYIEKQFTSEMSWDLVLNGKIHIDHIIPLNVATTKDDVYKLFHYTNLQPLWANDNLLKYTKMDVEKIWYGSITPHAKSS